LDALKSLILDTDRVENEKQYSELKSNIEERLTQLEDEINDPQKFSQKLEQSKSYVIDVLAPVIFKIIRKGIKLEMQKINQGAKSSVGNVKSKLTNVFRFGRRKHVEIEKAGIVEVFLVNKDSGILISNYSKKANPDAEVIAAMFSAIKSFAETAYQESSDLNSIEYDNHTIQLYEYGTIYYAVVFSGILLPDRVDDIAGKVNHFTLNEFNEYRSRLGEKEIQLEFENRFHDYFKSII
jgi:predicted regulator of Ras-like GTPase activity (Roadblock/LC7/MglB family)